MDTTSLQHLIQAGAVGISIALIYLIYKIFTACSKSSEKILEVVERNATVITKLTDSIDVNTEATNNINEGLQNMSEVARDAMKLSRRRKLKE
jgi:hypothetical protein